MKYIVLLLITLLLVQAKEFNYGKKFDGHVCRVFTAACSVIAYMDYVIKNECNQLSPGNVNATCVLRDFSNDEDYVVDDAAWGFVGKMLYSMPPFGVHAVDTCDIQIGAKNYCWFFSNYCNEFGNEKIVRFRCVENTTDACFVDFAVCEAKNRVDMTKVITSLMENFE
jgi:hypothetical protein